MASQKHEITIVNPKGGKKKPKNSTKKRSAKKVPRKKKSKKSTTTRRRRPARRRRRRNPRATPTPRARNPRRRRRASRRRNPSLGRMLKIDLRDDLANSLWRLVGKLGVAFAVKRWGDPAELNPGSGIMSETTGARWGFKNLLIGWLAAVVTGELGGRFFGVPRGQSMYDGGVDMLTTKAFWSEIVHRIGGTGGAAMFGQDQDMAVLAQQAGEGDTLEDGQGNRWLLKGGKWVAMMGDMGQDALDEAMYGDLEQATPLDALQEATALDGYGHLMDPEAPAASRMQGRYDRRGSEDPYHATYL